MSSSKVAAIVATIIVASAVGVAVLTEAMRLVLQTYSSLVDKIREL